MTFDEYIDLLQRINKAYHTGNFHTQMPLSEYKARIGFVRPEHPFYEKEVYTKIGNSPDLL